MKIAEIVERLNYVLAQFRRIRICHSSFDRCLIEAEKS